MFKGMQYLPGFAHPNFHCHVTTTCNILRHNGVEIGKKDSLGAERARILVWVTALKRFFP